jgi:hypothetical protein
MGGEIPLLGSMGSMGSKFLQIVVQKFFSEERKNPLGRWRIEKCSAVIDNKIDMSNEDHCGPCGVDSAQKRIKFLSVYNKKEYKQIHNEKDKG